MVLIFPIPQRFLVNNMWQKLFMHDRSWSYPFLIGYNIICDFFLILDRMSMWIFDTNVSVKLFLFLLILDNPPPPHSPPKTCRLYINLLICPLQQCLGIHVHTQRRIWENLCTRSKLVCWNWHTHPTLVCSLEQLWGFDINENLHFVVILELVIHHNWYTFIMIALQYKFQASGVGRLVTKDIRVARKFYHYEWFFWTLHLERTCTSPLGTSIVTKIMWFDGETQKLCLPKGRRWSIS